MACQNSCHLEEVSPGGAGVSHDIPRQATTPFCPPVLCFARRRRGLFADKAVTTAADASLLQSDGELAKLVASQPDSPNGTSAAAALRASRTAADKDGNAAAKVSTAESDGTDGAKAVDEADVDGTLMTEETRDTGCPCGDSWGSEHIPSPLDYLTTSSNGQVESTAGSTCGTRRRPG